MIETPLRPRIDLDDGWEFVQGRARRFWLMGRGRNGRPVILPHSWNAADTYQRNRVSRSGWGAYRRPTALPKSAEGMSWKLRLGGFYGVGDVWLDGRRLVEVDGQFLGASIDLPRLHEATDCVFAIRLDNRWHRHVLPGIRQPDFIMHGGHAGGVWLEGSPELRLDVGSIRIDCTALSSRAELVRIGWSLEGSVAGAPEIVVEWRVTDAGGPPVASAPVQRLPLDPGNQSTVLHLPDPRCWSPAEPALYWAEGRLVVDDTVVDLVRVRFGVSRAEFRPREGFFLNGVRVELHGFNRHEAIPGFGNALPDTLQRRDAEILKHVGCNFVRLAHYPQSPAFLDACDELGMMVYAEIATWKSVRSARRWRKAARRQMHDLIVRDRHHPSVVVWGMGNESRSRKAYLELREIARDLDPRRPVTYAENRLYRARRHGTVGIPDVWSVNYELDVLEQACAASRLENVIISECCNHPGSLRGDDREELRQVATIEREWDRFADLPFVAGHAVWSFCDYATEHRKRTRRLPGLFDAWRQPKMAAELFRARFASAPFVSLFVTEPDLEIVNSRYRIEHRTDGEGRAPLELHAFTNCETLRIARDGSMLAVLEGAIHHVLPLFGAFEEIIATGSRDGAVVQDRVRKAGPAHHIHLRTTVGATNPTVEVEVEIHDTSNIVAGDWCGTVRLAVDGPGRCHSFNGASEVIVVRGVGRAFVTVDSAHDAVVVTASAPGLLPAILSLHGA